MTYALLDIKMDRPIDIDKHYISPGGYEVSLSNGQSILFDFRTYEGNVDEHDSSILHCTLTNLDTDSFRNACDIFKFATHINKITECYVYTGDDDDEDAIINIEKLLSFEIIDTDYYENKYGNIFSTDFIDVKKQLNIDELHLIFTQNLIDTFVIA